MIVLSTFGFLHYGKVIIMIPIRILDLFISYMAFVSDIHSKAFGSIASQGPELFFPACLHYILRYPSIC